ncbi:MAG: hypothetical protein ACR2H2_06235 [Solirubrobacteraceae bacterium]
MCSSALTHTPITFSLKLAEERTTSGGSTRTRRTGSTAKLQLDDDHRLDLHRHP